MADEKVSNKETRGGRGDARYMAIAGHNGPCGPQPLEQLFRLTLRSLCPLSLVYPTQFKFDKLKDVDDALRKR